MNPEVKAKWVAALRSGQYQQCPNVMTDGQRFCCLGVLCNLYGLENGVMWERDDHLIRFLGATHALPDQVIEWAGLEGPNPTVLNLSAAGHNDLGVPFTRIAEMIEVHL